METTETDVEVVADELTPEGKIQPVHGAVDPDGTVTGYLPGVSRPGILESRLADGPLGVRVNGSLVTLFPAPVALTATLGPNLVRGQKAAMGREVNACDQDALLGLGFNLIWVPYCGWNLEYYSGDPVLMAMSAGAAVEDI